MVPSSATVQLLSSRRGIPLIDAGLLGVAARCRSLSKFQCDQQNRYNDQEIHSTTIEKYILHGIPFLPLPGSLMWGGLKFHLGFDFASDPYVLTQNSRASCTSRTSGPGTRSSQSGTAQTLWGMDLIVCPKRLTFDWVSQSSPRSRRGSGRPRFQFRAMLSSVLKTNFGVVLHDLSDARAKLWRRVNPRVVASRRTSIVGTATDAERVP